MAEVDRLYSDACSKGHELSGLFHPRANLSRHRSRFQSSGDLETYGWRQTHCVSKPPARDNYPMMAMYHDLRLSTVPRDNMLITLTHSKEAEFDDKTYPATQGKYQCVYNPKAIIASVSESPDHKGYDEDITGDDVIPLKHWSDVVFLRWQLFCRGNAWRMRNLKYIIQTDIDNRKTEDIVFTAINKSGLPLQEWPWRDWRQYPNQGTATFHFGSDQFRAILASPNGAGAAHFLFQHKEALGNLVITAVSCFYLQGHAYNPWTLNMVFYIEVWH